MRRSPAGTQLVFNMFCMCAVGMFRPVCQCITPAGFPVSTLHCLIPFPTTRYYYYHTFSSYSFYGQCQCRGKTRIGGKELNRRERVDTCSNM
uniref:Secreted protein n=1 Tax=Panstrongylus lignarius TaxID=156445 RepID=A0A224XRL3_9HEMI